MTHILAHNTFHTKAICIYNRRVKPRWTSAQGQHNKVRSDIIKLSRVETISKRVNGAV